MLMYTDAAVVAWVKAKFPGNTVPVYMAPPEAARKRLALMQEKVAGVNSIGVPGITVFRTNAPLGDHRNSAQMSEGLPAGTVQSGPNAKKFNNLQVVPVRAEYTICAFTKQRSDMSTIERELAFLNIYNPVQFQIRVNSPENPTGPSVLTSTFSFPVSSDAITYNRTLDDKTGKVLWYETQKIFTVDTYWAKSSLTPFIAEIDVDFRNIIDNTTDPITDEDLGFIRIVPNTAG